MMLANLHRACNILNAAEISCMQSMNDNTCEQIVLGCWTRILSNYKQLEYHVYHDRSILTFIQTQTFDLSHKRILFFVSPIRRSGKFMTGTRIFPSIQSRYYIKCLVSLCSYRISCNVQRLRYFLSTNHVLRSCTMIHSLLHVRNHHCTSDFRTRS